MGSGEGPVYEAMEKMVAEGEKVGALFVRLYRPFSIKDFIRKSLKPLRKLQYLTEQKSQEVLGNHFIWMY